MEDGGDDNDGHGSPRGEWARRVNRLSAGRDGGRARSLDELGVDPQPSGAIRQRTFQPADGQFDRVQREHFDRLPDDRQRRGDEVGPGVVVEHDQAEIVGYRDRGLLDPAQDVAHLGGVAHDQSGRRGGQREEGAHGVASGVAAERDAVDQALVDVHARTGHGLAESGDAVAAGGGRQWTRDERDPPVPQIEQVLGGGFGGQLVVDRDHVGLRQFLDLTIDEHDVDAEPDESGPLVDVAAGRGGDHGADRASDERLDGVRLEVRILAGGDQYDVDAAGPRLRGHAVGEPREERVRQVGQHEADRRGRLLLELPSRGAGLVAEPLDDVDHPGPGLWGDRPRAVVQHTRDHGDRDTRFPGDVADGGLLLHRYLRSVRSILLIVNFLLTPVRGRWYKTVTVTTV